jgi:hypothetical protein
MTRAMVPEDHLGLWGRAFLDSEAFGVHASGQEFYVLSLVCSLRQPPQGAARRFTLAARRHRSLARSARVNPSPDNRVKFEPRLKDSFDMRQPTFELTLGEDDCRRAHSMMTDLVEVAHVLGGFLAGSAKVHAARDGPCPRGFRGLLPD